MKSTNLNERPESLNGDVLQEKEQQKSRYNKLQRAMQLWNVVHQKSKIVFKSSEGVKVVETPVWFVSEKYVCINSGVTLLVASILEVI